MHHVTNCFLLSLQRSDLPVTCSAGRAMTVGLPVAIVGSNFDEFEPTIAYVRTIYRLYPPTIRERGKGRSRWELGAACSHCQLESVQCGLAYSYLVGILTVIKFPAAQDCTIGWWSQGLGNKHHLAWFCSLVYSSI